MDNNKTMMDVFDKDYKEKGKRYATAKQLAMVISAIGIGSKDEESFISTMKKLSPKLDAFSKEYLADANGITQIFLGDGFKGNISDAADIYFDMK